MTGLYQPILHWRRDGYDVYVKNDGRDYWPIVEAYLRDTQKSRKSLIHRNGTNNQVYLVNTDSGKFVIKAGRKHTLGLRRFFPNAIGLTFYTRILCKVNRAVRRNFRHTADIYLVMEKWRGGIWLDYLILMEYVEGPVLSSLGNYAAYRDDLRRTMAEMRAHELTLEDTNPGNFIVSKEGIKAIDLGCRIPTFYYKVRESIRLRDFYGIDLPLKDPVSRFIGVLIKARIWLRKKFSKRN